MKDECSVTRMGATNIISNRSLGDFGVRAVKLAQDLIGNFLQQNEYAAFGLTSHEEPNAFITLHETQKSGRSTIIGTPNSGASVSERKQSPIDETSFCSTSALCPPPICRQFWKAGNYDDSFNSKPTCQIGTNYLRIHPKFLHSNATSHKWIFGAMAELLDNSVDEIQNGATFVIVDKTSNPRDGTPALLVQDDGGGMDPEVMRRCLSFGFSDKKSQNDIGKYGNGFKTSSMRIGADVVVFSRCQSDRLTQSVGLLSYTYLMRTRQDQIVVPMVDYEFDPHSDTWNTLHNEEHLKNNLSILLQWSPVATEAELLKQCDEIGPHGTKIIIYNIWHDAEGKIELDFDSDPEDICISGKVNNTANVSRTEASDQHLANRIPYSLRAYLSILYLRLPENFCILLRGRVVDYHNIAKDLKFPEFILYRPQNVEGSVVTTIGFLKEAPAVNIHGFNVYHKNRLILPFWHVTAYAKNRGRGVVGVLEANFIEPTHNKQDFERTPVFQKLEARLRGMALEYWDYHCGLIGYYCQKKPRARTIHHDASDSGPGHAGGCPHEVSGSSDHVAAKPEKALTPIHHKTKEATTKRKNKGHDDIAELENVKRRGVTVSRMFDSDLDGDVLLAVDPEKQLEDQEAANLIQEIHKFHALCHEYEKTDEELNLKITRLTKEVREAQREYDRLLLESRLLEKLIMARY
ncbi:Protein MICRORCHIDIA 6 [Orobanche gracilis]